MRGFAVVAFALLLGACVKVDIDLDLSSDNTVSGHAILAVDESLIELLGQSPERLFREVDLSDVPEGTTTEPYSDGDFVGRQFNFTDVELSEFSGRDPIGASGEEISITRVGDRFHVDGLVDLSGTDLPTGQVPRGLLDRFRFSIAISFPGPVTSSTGTVDGNTVTWSPRFGEATEIRAVASAVPSGPPWLLILVVVAGILVVGAIVFLVLRRNRPVPAAGPVDGASGPVASDEPAAIAPAPAARDSDDDVGTPPPVPPVSD